MPLPVTHVPDHLTLRAGVKRYLDANGFTTDEYTAPKFAVKVLRWKLWFPNPPTRQRVIALHDLHHVLTGYGTDFAGEAEIGAFELRGGCNTIFLWQINLAAAFIGLFVAPIRTVRAFFRAGGAHTLYVERRPLEAYLDRTIADLRRELGIPAGGYTAAR
ncbi:MAG TPA: hypothetical protein VIK91_16730 [Nannocystis sp.]